MKFIKTLLVSSMLIGAASTVNAVSVETVYNQTPEKTICIKHPEAADANKFFAKSTVLMFEVYKAGSKSDLDKIIASLKSDPAVESVNAGVLTGDYQAITLTLKSAKDKSWFVSQFKKAGLNHIKINNNPVTEIDKI